MPLVCDIVTGSWVDGPGLRTVIFLKGCPLRCAWCHNPEAQRAEQETIIADGVARPVGRAIPPERLAWMAARDKVFFDTTGGGVTFSGGEPLLFIDYVAAVAERLHGQGIHVTVETCGFFDLAHYERRLQPFVDLLLFDVKILDPAEHRRWTGADNAPILRNLEALAARGANLRLRMPLVPGITATEENLGAAAELLERLSIEQIDLLPYNPSGLDKARRMAGPSAAEVPASLQSPTLLQEELRWKRFLDRARATPATSATLLIREEPST